MSTEPQNIRSKARLAIEPESEWRTSQVEDLKVAIQAAHQGDFASDDEVSAVFVKYALGEKLTQPKFGPENP